MAARELLEMRRVKILGCGSAYIAGCVGAQLIEQLARVPAHAEPASEFRYRNPVIEPDTLYVAVSQSGETFDTLAAVQEIKRKGGRVLGIVNVVGSTIARECGRGIYLHAGPGDRRRVDEDLHLHGRRVRAARDSLGRHARSVDGAVARAAHGAGGAARADREHPRAGAADRGARGGARRSASDAYFVGRAAGLRGRDGRRTEAQGSQLPTRGSVSGFRAEARSARADRAGDADRRRAAARRPVREEISTIEEIRARSGPVLRRHPSGRALPVAVDGVIEVPKSEPELDALLLNIPLQLLAYHVALAKGRDIDQPRNLAKSVTVE